MLIINAKIVDSNNISEYDAIYIKEGIIDAVGNSSELLKYHHKDEILDTQGRMVFPGLINAHMHGYGILNSYFLGKTLTWKDVFEKLKEMQFQKEDMELIYYSAIVAGIFAIRNGITTIFDICYGSSEISEMIAEAYNVLGLRGIVYQSLDENNLDFIKNYRDKEFGCMKLGVAVSSNKDYIPIIKKLKKDDRLLVHEDEVSGESENLLKELLENELLSESSIFVHGNYSDKSIEVFKNQGLNLVSCPLVDSLLVESRKLMDNDINLCMGSGMINLNMFMAAKEAFKHSDLSTKEIDDIIQNNNTKLVQRVLNEKVGRIQKGYRADLYVSESTPAIGKMEYNLVYRDNFWIEDVIVNGKLVLKDREVVGVKEKEVYESIGEYISNHG